MFQVRAIIVVFLLFVFLLGRRLYRQWRRDGRLPLRRKRTPVAPLRVPAVLLAGAERTWVVFTTQYCASCGPLVERLKAAEPGSRVVKVDVADEPHLAEAFKVRSAPTVVLADKRGNVQARLVGAAAVDTYVATH